MPDKDQLDSAEAGLFAEIAGNLHNIDKHADGSDKTGLHSKHTKELINRLKSSGGLSHPRRPSSPIPEIPEIPDSAELKPIEITEEMIKEAGIDGNMDAIKNLKVEAPSMDIPQELINDVSKLDELRLEHQQEQNPQDPNQMELGFDVVKAEDVYNEINDLTTQIRLLRQEIREIKACLKQSE